LARPEHLIASFYERYCQVHNVWGDALPSVAIQNPGIGALEKKPDSDRRLFDEAAARLAVQLWEHNGKSVGGPSQFYAEARARLTAAIGPEADKCAGAARLMLVPRERRPVR
jgi:hypothetical protein